MRKKNTHILASCGIVLIVLLVVSLIPLAAVGQYDRMCFDDYDYSVITKHALANGGTLGDALSAAADTVSLTYRTWQGTFSAVFLFSLQPAIWGHSWYFLTPLILITAMLAGLGYFSYIICVRLLNGGKAFWVISWMISALLCLQFPRDPVEGYFWYNGGIFYTFFFGLLLIWIGLALDTTLRNPLRASQRWLRGGLLCLLAVILSGGNYPSALLLGIILTGWVVYCVWKRRDLLPISIVSFLMFGAGFLISIIAPGNAIRGASLEPLSAPMAIISSLIGMPKRILGQFFRFPGLLSIVLLVWLPVCIVVLRESKLRFRLPLLLPVASYLVISAMFTPSYYAMGYSGAYRLWNIAIFLFYILLMANVYYLVGWWKVRFTASYEKTLNWLLRFRKVAPVYLLVMVSASVLLCGVGPDFGLEQERAASVRAMEELQDGTARMYAEAFDAQAQNIVNDPVDSIEIFPITEPENILPNGNLANYLTISEEPDNWYGKELILAQTED